MLCADLRKDHIVAAWWNRGGIPHTYRYTYFDLVQLHAGQRECDFVFVLELARGYPGPLIEYTRLKMQDTCDAGRAGL